nr:MAG: hypothetical protein [Bacteriophage sp.]
MKTVKISNLQEGDLFMYKGVMYEIVHKDKWETYCKYINDKYSLGERLSRRYLYCSFSNYTKVEV